jgi:hypothetical protein
MLIRFLGEFSKGEVAHRNSSTVGDQVLQNGVRDRCTTEQPNKAKYCARNPHTLELKNFSYAMSYTRGPCQAE